MSICVNLCIFIELYWYSMINILGVPVIKRVTLPYLLGLSTAERDSGTVCLTENIGDERKNATVMCVCVVSFGGRIGWMLGRNFFFCLALCQHYDTMCPLSWLALLCLFSISALGHPNAVTGTATGHWLRCHRRCSDLGLACQLPCTWEWYLEMLVWFWTCTSTDLALWNKAFILKAQHTTEICDAELFKCQKFQNWSQEGFCSCLGAELWSAMGLQSPRCSHWNCLCSLVGQRQPLSCLTIDDYP